MVALAFDTHKAVKALKEAGADEALAEAVVATVGDAVGENIATKADIAELRNATEADIAQVRTDIAELRTATKADISESRAAAKTDIAEVRTEIAELRNATKADISELRTEIAEVKVDIAARFETLYHRLWAMALGIIAVLTALIKFIP